MIFKIKSKFDEHDVNGSVSFAFSFCFGGKCFLFREVDRKIIDTENIFRRLTRMENNDDKKITSKFRQTPTEIWQPLMIKNKLCEKMCTRKEV
jgi:hypothetical protein